MKAAKKIQTEGVVAVIQARMGSTRLPGKVLEPILDKPMLYHVVERVRRAHRVEDVIVATSDQAQDEPIRSACKKYGFSCFAGSESDVLDRFYQAALQKGATTVVRITADCPLLDPSVIDATIEEYLRSKADYCSNIQKYTYPEGLDTEVFTFEALERAWKEAKKPSEREHVTPYLRFSGKFRIADVQSKTDLSAKNFHWSVDTPSDLKFVREIFKALSHKADFGLEDILSLLAHKPELTLINKTEILNEGTYKSLYQEAKAEAARPLTRTESEKWFARTKRVIPGAAQTFSKAYHQHVQGVSPIFLQRGRGCRVWDVDGNVYIDYVQGLLANILGYANVEVNAAVATQLSEGHSFSLPHPAEVVLAEKLTKIIPCAEKVRFGKNGSDATSGAVRAARAFTKRDHVAVCGYHGWQDWYIGSTTRNMGVPASTTALTHTFTYNDLDSLEKTLKQQPNGFAAVVLEPFNFTPPAKGFLEGVKQLAHKYGALLIFDEICSGFHFGLGGAQKKFNVTPDLACFGKAMGNGYPISAIVGRSDVMKLYEEVFFSFTGGGEVASMAAALTVIETLEDGRIIQKMERLGKTLQDGFNALAKEAGLYPRFECLGYPQWSILKFRDADGKDSPLERTLFSQEIVKRGILMLVTHNMNACHDDVTTRQTLEVYASALKTLSGWLKDPNPSRFLEGPIITPVFKVRG